MSIEFPEVNLSGESIIQAGNMALAFAFDYSIDMGAIGADDPVAWGQIITGNAEYVYQNAEAQQRIVPTTYDFRSNLSNGHLIFDGVVSCTARLLDAPSGTTAPTIVTGSSSSGGVGYITYEQIGGGSYYTFDINIPDALSNYGSCRVVFASTPITLPMSYTNANPIYAYGVQKNVQPILRVTRNGKNDGIGFTTIPTVHNVNVYAPYAPVSSVSCSYNDLRSYIVDWANDLSVEGDLNITFVDADFYSYQEASQYFESESESETEVLSGGNTYIYVNADGTLTLNNDVTGNMPIDIDAEGNLNLNINAAAGAFGAGAIVVDPDADFNLNVDGTLAFNGDFSGDVVINETNITNNYYYYDPTEPDPTIDYDEILSEDELESILTQETYEIDTFPTYPIETINSLLPEKPIEPALPLALQSTPDMLNIFTDIIADSGLESLYFPLGVFSILCYCIRGHR